MINQKWKKKNKKQAVAELGQTQVKLKVIDEIVVEVRSWNCRWSWSSTTCPGGRVSGWWWSDETKLIQNSTLVKV